MTKTKTKLNNKVVPAQVDGMPIEVATEMLTTPGVKMTNRLRKNCMAAREKVYISASPIINGVDDEGKPELQYGPAAKDPTLKLANRAGKLKFSQLVSHHKRAGRRHAETQRNYLKLMQSNAPEHIKQSMGKLLTAQAEKFETAQSVLGVEITLRRNSAFQITPRRK